MKRLILSLALSTLVLLPELTLAEAPSLLISGNSSSIAQQIDSAIDQVRNAQVGVMIKNLSTDQVLYQHDNQQYYIPASNMKVFTAVAALEQLTPEYKYSTYIASPETNVNQGVFTGNMYVVFSGDPSLTRQDINNLFKQLKQNGINSIVGNIYIDDALFDQDGIVPSALAEDATYCFAAPVGAGNIDHNCTGVSVTPGPVVGALADANVIQTPDAMTLINQIITAGTKSCNIRAVKSAETDAYVLSGCINTKKGSEEFSLPVQNMRSYVAELMPVALKQANIEWTGNVFFGEPPSNSKMLALHQSAPLSKLIKHMLKKSDNLYANALFKTIGAHYFDTVGNWRTGAAAVKAILWENNGVNLLSADLVDGAGLSRENVITPEQMLQVLSTAYYRPLIAAALIPALPIGGVDGTLKGRLTEESYRHRVYAKTGTMNDVSSLSGYVKNAKNEVLTFSILINGTPQHLGAYRALEDRICEILIGSN